MIFLLEQTPDFLTWTYINHRMAVSRRSKVARRQKTRRLADSFLLSELCWPLVCAAGCTPFAWLGTRITGGWGRNGISTVAVDEIGRLSCLPLSVSVSPRHDVLWKSCDKDNINVNTWKLASKFIEISLNYHVFYYVIHNAFGAHSDNFIMF